jgi:hypothetical protein
LLALTRRAGDHRGNLAQGCAFAADARVRAGIVPKHTELATGVLCGTTPEKAARTTSELRPSEDGDGDVPAYEVWRQRLANEFISLGGVNT